MEVLKFYIFVFLLSQLVSCGGGDDIADIQYVDGLIANYSFDEGLGNVALDISGSKLHGTVYAASRVEEGYIGKGILFGSDDARISIDVTPQDNTMFFTDGLMSIEAWLKPSKIEVDKVYRIIGDYNYGGFYLQIRDGKIEVLYEGQSYHYGTVSIEPDAWTHIAITSNGTDIISYVNGLEDSRTNVSLPIQYLVNISIGSHRVYIEDYIEEFPGVMDELRIWNISRTSDQIANDYNQQLIASPNISLEAVYWAGLYDFNELSGNIASDTSGLGNDGLIIAASRVPGYIDNALMFGADDARVTVDTGSNTMSFNDGVISIEAWIKPEKIETNEIYQIIGDYNQQGLAFRIRDRRLEVLFDGKSFHYGAIPIQANVWTHIDFTSDGNNITTYLDGIEDSKTNITLPIKLLLNVMIGAHRVYPEGIIEEFPGIIDELEILEGVLIKN